MISVTEKPNPNYPNEVSFEQRALDLQVMQNEEDNQILQDRKSPYSRFYQVNKDNSEYLRNCLKENPKALMLLLFIFDHMDKYNAVICSYQVFHEALGMSKATIQRSVKYLKDNGFVYVYKTGTSNVYVANNNLVWNSWGNNVKYCKFPANIILSSAEQESITEHSAKVFDKRITTVEVKESNN